MRKNFVNNISDENELNLKKIDSQKDKTSIVVWGFIDIVDCDKTPSSKTFKLLNVLGGFLCFLQVVLHRNLSCIIHISYSFSYTISI